MCGGESVPSTHIQGDRHKNGGKGGGVDEDIRSFKTDNLMIQPRCGSATIPTSRATACI